MISNLFEKRHSGTCKGINKNGLFCSKKTKHESGYCYYHIYQQKRFIDDKPSECIVCCEELNMRDPLECGHWIHLECIKKSLKAVCPVCCYDLSRHFTEEELEAMKENRDEVIHEWEEDIMDRYDEIEFYIPLPLPLQLFDISTDQFLCQECFNNLNPACVIRYLA